MFLWRERSQLKDFSPFREQTVSKLETFGLKSVARLGYIGSNPILGTRNFFEREENKQSAILGTRNFFERDENKLALFSAHKIRKDIALMAQW